ncbi:MAG: branched-chain amino acid transport system ATP-binding protein [Methylobacteriaceae bacterium]|jgi:branched-chain amino acid transport system ATP-binding protein|nr:branched-chain amino acid transport system ATP-binding protein [Methylobacteriaceae bacterium]
MSVAKSILSLRNVQIAYGKAQALHDVSLEIGEGEVVALIGANGAGKTTTLRAISGLLKPSSGDIEFEGKPIAGKSPDAIVRAGIAQCPEERHVWPEMTVAENLELGAFLCRDRHEVDRRAGMVVHRFPRLRERFKQLAGTLSGGEQQMLAIGRALMSEPKLLLLDEPSLGLSPLMSEEVLSVIVELRGQGITIVLVEQNVHNALSVADRAYVFETGRVVAHDTAAGLLGNPDLLKAYLGA